MGNRWDPILFIIVLDLARVDELFPIPLALFFCSLYEPTILRLRNSLPHFLIL